MANNDAQQTSAESPGRRKKLAAIVAAAALAVALLAFWIWRDPAHDATSAGRGRPSATIAAVAAVYADLPVRLEALGTVTPLAVAVVRAQVPGVLTQVLYREGALVKAGEPLAQIDARPFQLALEQAQGALARDAAQLANARQQLERDRTLLAQDSVAQQDVDTQATTVKQLEGTVEADRAQLDSARLNLAFARVTAPIAGRVGLRPVDVGNYVTPADTAGVATITQLAPIDVIFTLPADSVAQVSERLRGGAHLEAVAFDRTRTRVLGRGEFLTLDNQVDTQTGTVRAKARFANADGALFPSQFVNLRLQVDVVKAAIVVPGAAVRHGPKGDFVYVVGKDHKARLQLVTAGISVDDRTAIVKGLAVGERVVTEGGDRLVDGSVVHEAGAADRKTRSAAGQQRPDRARRGEP